MPAARLAGIPGFSIDRVAAAAGGDPAVLRLENLDTDLRPPASALAATRAALDEDDANSYLPFVGQKALREAVAAHVDGCSGAGYTAANVVVTCGGTEAMLDALLALTDPGDEVILTDPTYAGMIYRARLAGCATRLVPFVEAGAGEAGAAWRLDLDALCAAVTARTRVVFLMNPSMPSGAVLNADEWTAVADLCHRHDLWLLYNAAMERILFDGRPLVHPAGLEGMAARTVTVGSVSKAYRMIGWRVGWVVGPEGVMDDVARVHVYNCVTPPGLGQAGALAALTGPDDGVAEAVAEWQRRRDVTTAQLDGYRTVPAGGGWSQLLDVGALGLGGFEASARLLEQGRVAVTPMRDWGAAYGDRFVRLVFSNEPVQRLATLGERVQRTLGGPHG
jgi:aspartate/methionine/tyrosine aminotransferase